MLEVLHVVLRRDPGLTGDAVLDCPASLAAVPAVEVALAAPVASWVGRSAQFVVDLLVVLLPGVTLTVLGGLAALDVSCDRTVGLDVRGVVGVVA